MPSVTYSFLTFANDSSVGSVAWSNASKAQTSNDDYATVSVSVADQVSNYLKVTKPDGTIPADAVLTSIVIEIERKADANDRIVDSEVKLVVGGLVQSDNQASGTNWTTTEQYYSYTFSSSLPSTAQVNGPEFGVALSVQWVAAPAPQASVDHVRVTFNYTAPTVGAILSCVGC